uniref:AAA family ATPase n=1 Tax=Actinoalloteichus spitiensis TaxID=252394 RepID=UPI0003656FDC
PETANGLVEATSADWWFYPHPAQRRIAFRRWRPGPVRVTGGPGTGKTTVALHRAVALARREPEARVLLTAPDERRADVLRTRLAGLVEAPVARRVEVCDVGELARRVRAEASDGRPFGVERAETEEWVAVLQQSVELSARERALLTPAFLTAEYREVLGGRGLVDLGGYLAADRSDRSVALAPAERATVWRLAGRFEARLRERQVLTGSVIARSAADLAERAAREADAPRVTRYHHLVVDDAQDLDPTHWRLLRALVPAGPDDVLLCVDASQRATTGEEAPGVPEEGEVVELVHERRATLELVRARTELFADLVDAAGASGPRAERRGPAASFLPFETEEKERRGVVELVRAWRARHGADGGTAVLATTGREADVLLRRLGTAGLGGVRLGEVAQAGAVSVWVGTLDEAVGCAFRRVVVVGADAERLPARRWAEQEPAGFGRLLERRERRLLHLACARAADQLVITWTGEPSRFLTRPAGVD